MRNKDIFSNKNKLFMNKDYLFNYANIILYFVCFSMFYQWKYSLFYSTKYAIYFITYDFPLILSLVGLNDFKIEKNAEHVKIYSNCIFMSKFSENFSEKMIINIKEPFENKFSLHILD